MQKFKMGSPSWGEMTLGNSGKKMKEIGCFVTSLSMLDNRTPDIVLDILNRNNAFNNKALLLSDVAAKALGMKYKGKSTKAPNFPCVAETDAYSNIGIPSHFFVYLEPRKIIDPIDGQEKPNPYNIVSYRLFKEKKEEPVEIPTPLPIPPVDISKVEVEREPKWLERLWLKIIGFLLGLKNFIRRN